MFSVFAGTVPVSTTFLVAISELAFDPNTDVIVPSPATVTDVTYFPVMLAAAARPADTLLGGNLL